jgi:hypothetical protein
MIILLALPDTYSKNEIFDSFYLVGSINFKSKFFIGKYFLNGDSIWFKEYPISARTTPGVILDKDNSLISVTSYSDSFYIFKVDASGELIWKKDFKRTQQKAIDLHYQLLGTEDGFYVAGSQYNGLDWDIWLAKYRIEELNAINEREQSISNL